MSPGVSGFHQHLTLLVAVPLGVLARGVAVHVVVMVSALICWGVLYQGGGDFIFQIYKLFINKFHVHQSQAQNEIHLTFN